MHQLKEFEDQKTKELKLAYHYPPELISSKGTDLLSVETKINLKVTKKMRILLQSNVHFQNKMVYFNSIFPHLKRTKVDPSKAHEGTRT